MGLQAEKNWKEKLWASRDGIGIGTVLVVPHWHTFCIIATLSVLRSLSRCDHRPMFFGSRSMMLLCLSFCLRNPSLCSTTLPRRKQVYCRCFCFSLQRVSIRITFLAVCIVLGSFLCSFVLSRRGSFLRKFTVRLRDVSNRNWLPRLCSFCTFAQLSLPFFISATFQATSDFIIIFVV